MTDVGPEALDLLTMAELAERLKVSEKTVARMIRQGVFTKLKVGGSVRVDEAEYVAYKKHLHEQAQATAAKAS
jgi:excisionase family DNA binding protein